jgi:hypothetical protein
VFAKIVDSQSRWSETPLQIGVVASTQDAMLVVDFAFHKFAGMLLQFSAQGRMLMQELPQVRVIFQVAALVNELRITHQVVADVRMAVEESIKARQFTAASITINGAFTMNCGLLSKTEPKGGREKLRVCTKWYPKILRSGVAVHASAVCGLNLGWRR